MPKWIYLGLVTMKISPENVVDNAPNITFYPYVRSVPLSTQSNYAFYNLAHDSLVVLSSDIGKAVINNDFSPLSEDELTILLDEKILTKTFLSEQDKFSDYYESLCKATEITSAIVCITTKCNLSCVYCFQGKANERIHMDNKTANSVACQIIKRSNDANNNAIDITFTGGEPLLNYNIIISIASSIFEHCSSNNKVFGFKIITNGTLLTNSSLKQLREIGLDGVQVTIDGPPETHNKRRFFSNYSGTYSCIIGNLNHIDMPVTINVVIDEFNSHHLTELIHELSCILKNKSNFTFSFTMRAGVPGSRSSYGRPLSKQQRMEILPHIQEAFKATVRAGFNLTRPGLWSPCTAYRENAAVFSPDGSQFKCINYIGNPTLPSDSFQQDAWGAISYELPLSCHECSVLPICFGGCRFNNLSFDRQFHQVFCLYSEHIYLIDAYIKATADHAQR